MVDDACPICQTPLAAGQDPCPSCGASRGPGTLTRHLPAGHALQRGRFTVGRVLGEGGFGITYKGAHRVLGHLVAIKEYFPAHAQRVGTAVSVPASQQAAFIREREGLLKEAQVLFGLRAPGIVQVYDAFQENGTAYIVMEYLEGRTLEARIQQEGRIPADEVQRLAQALGQALEAVHAQHLLHRDIKPANVMLTPEGRIVLIDFGSARAFQRDLTQKHTRIVTPGYAAPEQYSEEARFGPYTDIFGLGATLYHALTGKKPPSAIDRIQSGRALSFSAGLPASLASAVRQALELRVDNRPSSVAVFLDLMQKPPSIARTGHAIPAAARVGTKPTRKTSPVPASNGDPEVLVALEALMALYQATNGSQWLHQTGWLSNAHLDTWFGVYDSTLYPSPPAPWPDSTVHSYLTYPPLGINKSVCCTMCGALNHGGAFCEECGEELTTSASSRVLFTGLVVGLDLENNRLSGPIPAELGQMTGLWKRIAWKMSKEEKEWERRKYFLWKMSKLKNSKPQA